MKNRNKRNQHQQYQHFIGEAIAVLMLCALIAWLIKTIIEKTQ